MAVRAIWRPFNVDESDEEDIEVDVENYTPDPIVFENLRSENVLLPAAQKSNDLNSDRKDVEKVTVNEKNDGKSCVVIKKMKEKVQGQTQLQNQNASKLGDAPHNEGKTCKAENSTILLNNDSNKKNTRLNNLPYGPLGCYEPDYYKPPEDDDDFATACFYKKKIDNVMLKMFDLRNRQEGETSALDFSECEKERICDEMMTEFRHHLSKRDGPSTKKARIEE